MATKLFLRSTQTNGIGATYFDMLTGAGASSTTAITTTTASGDNIQWTQTEGGSVIQFISGRAPSGGFTLTTTDISIWAHESGTGVNAGGGYRLFKRDSLGIETELLGGQYEDGVEFTKTTPTEMAWVGNPTDTIFLEDDRILLKLYAVNVGTMGAGTVTLTYNGADAATGDSFLNIAETVAFKADLSAISGSSAATFTTAAALTGAGALSATATVTFSTSAALDGLVLGSGSTTLTFSTLGAITGQGALAGASSVAFSPAGLLQGAGELAGSAGLTFSLSGLSIGAGALAGLTTFTFSLSGTGTLEGGVPASDGDWITINRRRRMKFH